jgi:FAD-dependent urate hydroxylase
MDTDVAIVGAGPYGLATAAHLRARGVDSLVLGRVMGAWEQMPSDMKLRSFRESTSIGDPEGRLTIDDFERERGTAIPTPVPVTDFIAYGRWFQAQAVAAADPRFVASIERGPDGFRLRLDDGTELAAARVVVAAGIAPFVRMPSELSATNGTIVSHSSGHSDLSALAGRRVFVVGAGQSALEWGALAHRAGATVEIACRRQPRYLRGERVHDRAGVMRGVLYPSWGVGPPGLNLIMGRPTAYRLLPRKTAWSLAYRAIRPAGAAWLRPLLEPVRITVGVSVRSITADGTEAVVTLDDDSERRVDHVIAATGYQVDIARYPFLAPALVEQVARVDGFPRLSKSYESSVPGLYFVGAPAAASMGPGMRFVSHSGMAAAAVAAGVGRARQRGNA